MATDLYTKGREEGKRRAYETTDNWLRPTLGPLLWIGVPLAATWYFMSPRAAMSFGTKAAASTTKKGGSNPLSDMMEMMMPIKKREFRIDVKGTKFDDVIGIPEAKSDVQQYVDFLKNPKRFMRLGARIPKGCILTGEPGTGKTLLAKAVAGEAEVPFFSCNGADFVEIVSGSGPKRIRELFAEARAAAPCIIFIDEIDAVGSRGSKNGNGMSSEDNRTINQLLAELDGLSTGESPAPVVVMAATNILDNIDKALLREGRFDRKVDVEMPDVAARRDIFQYYLNKVVTGDATGRLTTSDEAKTSVAPDPNASNVAMARQLAELTPGISPATIATIVNEAALAAGVAGKPKVTFDDLNTAIDNTLVGKKHRSRMSDVATRRTAIHESGHAVTAFMLPQQNAVLKVSITPRGNAAGFTQRAGHEFHEYQTNVTLFTDLVVMMGGRAAEEVLLDGDVSVGAMDDVQRATELCMKKLMSFGMSENTGLLAFQPQEVQQGREFAHFSETTQMNAEKEAKRLVDAAYALAHKLVSENRSKVDRLTQALLERKEVHAQELVELWGSRPSTPTTAQLTDKLLGLTTPVR